MLLSCLMTLFIYQGSYVSLKSIESVIHYHGDLVYKSNTKVVATVTAVILIPLAIRWHQYKHSKGFNHPFYYLYYHSSNHISVGNSVDAAKFKYGELRWIPVVITCDIYAFRGSTFSIILLHLYKFIHILSGCMTPYGAINPHCGLKASSGVIHFG